MNILKNNRRIDVVVVGAGLAGIKAAVTAAKRGREVLLCVKSVLCSGSSFYTLMDTLHCQAPFDEADKAVFLRDIDACGGGMNDPVMNRYYVDHIAERIAEFPEMGVYCEPLPERKLACFASHPHRLYSWTGWAEIRARLREILTRFPNLSLCERTEAVTAVTERGTDGVPAVRGVLLFDKQRAALRFVGCSSLILATGGFGALYEHNLNSPDVAGDGHVLALEAGARLINLEFNQFIPGLIRPVNKIVFREGTLDYCEGLIGADGTDVLRQLLPDPAEYAECLRLRAFHGPFTSADLSKYFDIALMKACLAEGHTDGIQIRYSPRICQDGRSYVSGYLEWLKKNHRVNLCRDKITIAPFFHAANGGILVDHRCETDVRGLFACGEAAGGIHGADRLGGNASGSCLVFGYLAAESACACADAVRPGGEPSEAELAGLLESVYRTGADHSLPPQEVIAAVKREMWLGANVLRTEERLAQAVGRVRAMRERYSAWSFFGDPARIPAAVQAHRFLLLSEALLTAMRSRRESRGAHYREDYPAADPAFGRRTTLSLREGSLRCEPEPRRQPSSGSPAEGPDSFPRSI